MSKTTITCDKCARELIICDLCQAHIKDRVAPNIYRKVIIQDYEGSIELDFCNVCFAGVKKDFGIEKSMHGGFIKK